MQWVAKDSVTYNMLLDAAIAAKSPDGIVHVEAFGAQFTVLETLSALNRWLEQYPEQRESAFGPFGSYGKGHQADPVA